MAEFASQEQIDAATQELRTWEQEFPEAAQKLKALWHRSTSLTLGISAWQEFFWDFRSSRMKR